MLQVKLQHPDARLPSRATPGSAGLDFYLPEQVPIYEHETIVIDLGLSIAIPSGFVGLLATRSSMAATKMRVEGGIIDSDYRGPLKVILSNNADQMRLLPAGHKIAQLLLLPYATTASVEQVTVFEQEFTERGEKGFGSSDLKQ